MHKSKPGAFEKWYREQFGCFSWRTEKEIAELRKSIAQGEFAREVLSRYYLDLSKQDAARKAWRAMEEEAKR